MRVYWTRRLDRSRDRPLPCRHAQKRRDAKRDDPRPRAGCRPLVWLRLFWLRSPGAAGGTGGDEPLTSQKTRTQRRGTEAPASVFCCPRSPARNRRTRDERGTPMIVTLTAGAPVSTINAILAAAAAAGCESRTFDDGHGGTVVGVAGTVPVGGSAGDQQRPRKAPAVHARQPRRPPARADGRQGRRGPHRRRPAGGHRRTVRRRGPGSAARRRRGR